MSSKIDIVEFLLQTTKKNPMKDTEKTEIMGEALVAATIRS